MIRDPSDGTMRHNEAILDRMRGVPANRVSGDGKFDLGNPNVPQANDNSGLPLESQKPKEIAKLEKARAWLKDYHGKN